MEVAIGNQQQTTTSTLNKQQQQQNNSNQISKCNSKCKKDILIDFMSIEYNFSLNDNINFVL
jgi:hypothetical protein